MTSLVIVGGGGLGRVVAESAIRSGKYRVEGFLDDSHKVGTSIMGSLKILSGTSDIFPLAADTHFLVAIGANQIRSELFRRLRERFRPASLIDPSAIVSTSAIVGEGVIVLAGALVNSNVILGDNSIIDSRALLDHDCRIGEHAYVGPGSLVGSRSNLSPFFSCTIGTTLMPGTRA